MSNPTVDILLATYDGEKFLDDLLGSLAAQSFLDWRILVRDDCSTDDTLAMIELWAESQNIDIEILRDDDKLGPKLSFARLLAASDAEYFLFCDQDDVWLPDKVQTMVDIARRVEAKHGKNMPVLVHCDLEVVDENLTSISRSFWAHSKVNPAHAFAHKRLLIENFSPGCAMLGNRALANLAHPIPHGAIMHDWWVALVAGYLGVIELVREPLVLYRQHGSNSIGAQNWSLLSILQRFAQGPSQAFLRTKRIISLTNAQSRVFAEMYSDQIDPSDKSHILAFVQLPSMRFITRKSYYLRAKKNRPDSILRTLVLWIFT